MQYMLSLVPLLKVYTLNEFPVPPSVQIPLPLPVVSIVSATIHTDIAFCVLLPVFILGSSGICSSSADPSKSPQYGAGAFGIIDATKEGKVPPESS